MLFFLSRATFRYNDFLGDNFLTGRATTTSESVERRSRPMMCNWNKVCIGYCDDYCDGGIMMTMMMMMMMMMGMTMGILLSRNIDVHERTSMQQAL